MVKPPALKRRTCRAASARIEGHGLQAGLCEGAAGAERRRPLPGVRRHQARSRPLPGRAALCRRGAPADHRVVLQRLPRHGPASGRAGRHARGARRGRRGLRRHAQHLGHHALSRGARGRDRRPARQGGGAAVHVGLRRQRHHAGDAAQAAAGADHILGRQEPRLHDRRHSQRRRREGDLAQQRSGRSGSQAEARSIGTGPR